MRLTQHNRLVSVRTEKVYIVLERNNVASGLIAMTNILHPVSVLFTGYIMDANKREKVMTLYEALKTKLFESVYDPFDSTLLDPNNGQRIDVNQAVKRSQLGHKTCMVYDTVKNRQVGGLLK